ncbi:DeoR/GlpR family DNA-binding transcription regulator [Metabacillus sp. Hm71]|uniref:DeoR/GlpR family DNA-binding transcription regulator n=1 Tax=Metabacillus sp. Hm71 TaxID=3450743 RepID=UPI003F442E3E
MIYEVLPQERQKQILKHLHEYRSVKIVDLSKTLNVTRETIRKDLYEMEEEGLVRKVHGGAILNKANLETNYHHRIHTNDGEKRSIAKKAAELVADGDTMYIDYGTTALYFVREILDKKNLTILTNSLPIANELIDYSNHEVVVIGGSIRKNERSLFGPIAYRVIQDLYVDIGFFGTGGVDLEAGFTNFHLGESEVSRLMVKHSQKRVLLADYSKFNTQAMNKVASFDEIDILITDTNTNQELIQKLRNNNMSLIIVDVESSEQDD